MLSRNNLIKSSIGIGCLMSSSFYVSDSNSDTYTIYKNGKFDENTVIGRYGFKIPFTYTVSVPRNSWYKVKDPFKYHFNSGNGEVRYTLLESIFLDKQQTDKTNIEDFILGRIIRIEILKKTTEWNTSLNSFLLVCFLPIIFPLVIFSAMNHFNEQIKPEMNDSNTSKPDVIDLILKDQILKDFIEKMGIEVDLRNFYENINSGITFSSI